MHLKPLNHTSCSKVSPLLALMFPESRGCVHRHVAHHVDARQQQADEVPARLPPRARRAASSLRPPRGVAPTVTEGQRQPRLSVCRHSQTAALRSTVARVTRHYWWAFARRNVLGWRFSGVQDSAHRSCSITGLETARAELLAAQGPKESKNHRKRLWGRPLRLHNPCRRLPMVVGESLSGNSRLIFITGRGGFSYMIAVGIVRDSRALTELLREFRPGQGPFVIVPNWHCTVKGYGTDARTLECLLEALPGEKTVVEAYDADRTDDPGRFQGLDLEAAREHWDYLREQDQIFLRETGIGKVLDEHGAEYLNVTEEQWAGRTADGGEVRTLVEDRYGPVGHAELYGMVPQKLWEQRGCTLINYAKIKVAPSADGLFFSLSMKNLFGLIPVPDRTRYHGSEDQGLARSIVDANQIYFSLFRVISVCEAMRNARISPDAGFKDDAALVENLGLVAASDRSVELDAYLVAALGDIPAERHFLQVGARIFGAWDEEDFLPLPAETGQRLREIMARRGCPKRQP